jgi:hypothetical protein
MYTFIRPYPQMLNTGYIRLHTHTLEESSGTRRELHLWSNDRQLLFQSLFRYHYIY